MRRLSVRRRLSRRRLSVRGRLSLWWLRLRLARLRWLWLWRLWLLLVMGTLRHLLTGSHPKHNKSPSQHHETGGGSTVLASVPTERGATSIRPNA